ncbi:nucleolin 1 [Iris pallida]|uniref:Nucleolin 1 n=1 Tax=Iris pallida TaxID=29817 RepID=A0AAX6GIE2_IRIPA|nr:nucleolin 1 [Iris pallida]KAJ6829033.1 nucleolin 1 [Iris pallida]
MDGPDRGGEDRTFRISFAGDGVSRLRDGVKEKLKEIVGDYTDDTLVDYVLVLLRNGRSKDESQRELNVFLGDDSVTFVSWLWEHLSSNLHLYSQQKESRNEVDKTTHSVDEHSGRQNSQIEHVHGNVKIDSENVREESKISRSRRSRDWKGLTQEETDTFPLSSTVTKILHSDEKSHIRSNVRRSPPKSQVQLHRKWGREEEREPIKRDATSRQVTGAARRLLQFAVRDAVKTVQQSSSRSEPALKRLRSVVSTSRMDCLLDERPQRIRLIAPVAGPVSAALKAASEAAEGVTKTRCSSSVFDRLSHAAFAAEPIKQPSKQECMLEDGEYDDDRIPESNHEEYGQGREYDGEYSGDITMLHRDNGAAAASASDNDGYDNGGTAGHQHLNACQIASSANKDNNSLTVQYTVAQDANEVARATRLVDQDPPGSATTKPSSKIVNISVNVNTWKPSHYEVRRDVTHADTQVAVKRREMGAGNTNARLAKENNVTVGGNETETACGIVQKESQKTLSSTPGSNTTVRPFEGIDSRTVFVNNVHFAATKDALSRHFNKSGEVLKVIIVTDAATGQPKGSAYVEFLRKESAELALSLTGTSFMSRILKVIRKSSMHHEVAPVLGWPRMARASPFSSSRLRSPLTRGGLSGAFRARLPVKPGARSLQWKRDVSTAQNTAEGTKSNQNASGNNAPSPTGQNLTYIRPAAKVDASSGSA